MGRAKEGGEGEGEREGERGRGEEGGRVGGKQEEGDEFHYQNPLPKKCFLFR